MKTQTQKNASLEIVDTVKREDCLNNFHYIQNGADLLLNKYKLGLFLQKLSLFQISKTQKNRLVIN